MSLEFVISVLVGVAAGLVELLQTLIRQWDPGHPSGLPIFPTRAVKNLPPVVSMLNHPAHPSPQALHGHDNFDFGKVLLMTLLLVSALVFITILAFMALITASFRQEDQPYHPTCSQSPAFTPPPSSNIMQKPLPWAGELSILFDIETKLDKLLTRLQWSNPDLLTFQLLRTASRQVRRRLISRILGNQQRQIQPAPLPSLPSGSIVEDVTETEKTIDVPGTLVFILFATFVAVNARVNAAFWKTPGSPFPLGQQRNLVFKIRAQKKRALVTAAAEEPTAVDTTTSLPTATSLSSDIPPTNSLVETIEVYKPESPSPANTDGATAIDTTPSLPPATSPSLPPHPTNSLAANIEACTPESAVSANADKPTAIATSFSLPPATSPSPPTQPTNSLADTIEAHTPENPIPAHVDEAAETDTTTAHPPSPPSHLSPENPPTTNSPAEDIGADTPETPVPPPNADESAAADTTTAYPTPAPSPQDPPK
ncbi:MAG: hypothetical protein Q9219_007124, partial [cf. Caloplaca sp. 3 TL-2023]